MFIGRTDAEAEIPVLWLPDAKSWLIGKDPDAGRDWGQEEKGTTEDEMTGWHHRLDRHEFEWTPGVGDREGGLACCDSLGHKESDTTEWLNRTELMGLNAMILSFWMLSFKLAFSLFSFTLIKRLFSSSSFSAIRVASAYMRLLIFSQQSWLQLMIHPAWHFAWCTLHIS